LPGNRLRPSFSSALKAVIGARHDRNQGLVAFRNRWAFRGVQGWSTLGRIEQAARRPVANCHIGAFNTLLNMAWRIGRGAET
jgi:hypothetical protein